MPKPKRLSGVAPLSKHKIKNSTRGARGSGKLSDIVEKRKKSASSSSASPQLACLAEDGDASPQPPINKRLALTRECDGAKSLPVNVQTGDNEEWSSGSDDEEFQLSQLPLRTRRQSLEIMQWPQLADDIRSGEPLISAMAQLGVKFQEKFSSSGTGVSWRFWYRDQQHHVRIKHSVVDEQAPPQISIKLKKGVFRCGVLSWVDEPQVNFHTELHGKGGEEDVFEVRFRCLLVDHGDYTYLLQADGKSFKELCCEFLTAQLGGIYGQSPQALLFSHSQENKRIHRKKVLKWTFGDLDCVHHVELHHLVKDEKRKLFLDQEEVFQDSGPFDKQCVYTISVPGMEHRLQVRLSKDPLTGTVHYDLLIAEIPFDAFLSVAQATPHAHGNSPRASPSPSPLPELAKE